MKQKFKYAPFFKSELDKVPEGSAYAGSVDVTVSEEFDGEYLRIYFPTIDPTKHFYYDKINDRWGISINESEIIDCNLDLGDVIGKTLLLKLKNQWLKDGFKSIKSNEIE